jgi:hypothetical protein
MLFTPLPAPAIQTIINYYFDVFAKRVDGIDLPLRYLHVVNDNTDPHAGLLSAFPVERKPACARLETCAHAPPQVSGWPRGGALCVPSTWRPFGAPDPD